LPFFIEERIKIFQKKYYGLALTELADNWWDKRHERCIEQIQKGNIDLLMIGDSITHYWEWFGQKPWDRYYTKRKAINLGFAGDMVESVLRRLERLPLEKIQPKMAILLCGTNNIIFNRGTPREISQRILEIIQLLLEAFPKMVIIVLGIFPFIYHSVDYQKEVDEVNFHLANFFVDTNNVTVLDIGGMFLTKKGEISQDLLPDLVHPSEKGYWLWAKTMEPLIKKIFYD